MKIYGNTGSEKEKISIRGFAINYTVISLFTWSILATGIFALNNTLIISLWDVSGLTIFIILCCTGFYYLHYRCNLKAKVGYFYGGLFLSLYNLILLEILYRLLDIEMTDDSVFMLTFPYAVVLFFTLYILLRGLHILIWRFEPTIVSRRYSEPMGLKLLLNGIFTLLLFVGNCVLVIFLMVWRLNFLGF